MRGSVTLMVNGEQISVPEGTSLGSVLHTLHGAMRRSPKAREARGLYCGMGVCFECMVTVDGRNVRSCITPVAEGMRVETEL